METTCRCHSCGTEVNASTRRCPHCYVALEAASRAPAPLRAGPSASSTSAPAGVVASGAVSGSAAAAVADDQLLSVAIRCPSCEASVLPLTGWCSYCMDPLPLDGPLDVDAGDLAPDQAPEAPGGQIITGPWPNRPMGPTVEPTLEPTYATWRQRAQATVIDGAVFAPGLLVVGFIPPIGLVLLVVAVVVSGWQLWRQGRTGQTIGQRRVGISLVRESDLAPVGARRAALRQLAHVIDAALLGLGYLWPLWDAKHQTFADQLCATIVVAG